MSFSLGVREGAGVSAVAGSGVLVALVAASAVDAGVGVLVAVALVAVALGVAPCSACPEAWLPGAAGAQAVGPTTDRMTRAAITTAGRVNCRAVLRLSVIIIMAILIIALLLRCPCRCWMWPGLWERRGH